MAKLNFALILGWPFDRDLADRAAKFVKTIVEKDHNIRVIGDPFGNEPDQQQTPATISSFIAQDDSFVPDGFIFVSTEHNGCIPPSLTTVLYQHEKEYFCHKPSLIVVYSDDHSSAGRAAKLLRSICGELGSGSVKKIVALPEIQNNLDRNGVPCTDVIKQRLEKNLEACLGQLYWTAMAFKQYRTNSSEAPMGRRMPPLNIVIFLSSTRDGRLADRVLKFIKPRIEAKFDVKIHDPNEMPFEMLKQPLFMYQDPSKIPAFLQKAAQEIASADGFIFVSAEYYNSMPPALSNMVNHFAPWDFLHKPSAIITYSAGAFGGCRAAVQLRSFLAEVGCSSVSRVFSIPEAQNALDENGVPTSDSMKERLEKNIKVTLDQFYWTANALKDYKQKHPPPAFVMPS